VVTTLTTAALKAVRAEEAASTAAVLTNALATDLPLATS